MAVALQLADFRDGYVQLVERVRLANDELLDPVVEIADWFDLLAVGTGRGVSVRYAAWEAMSAIGEFSSPARVVELAPERSAYRQQSGAFHGARGARVEWQLEKVVRRLKVPGNDLAVLTVWDKKKDLFTKTNEKVILDYPQTLAVGFRARRDTIDVSVTMRDADVWSLAYEPFVWSQLALSVARSVGGLRPGRLTLHAFSFYLRPEDRAAASRLHRSTATRVPHPSGVGGANRDWHLTRKRAQAIRDGKLPAFASESEVWFHEQVNGA